ncbi:MAG TPA: hypothetical protein VFV50_17230 [Bdellovibrionales bacterium]|nr:hypothetical protein [Bdellovibrionales bacterium]
MTKLNIRQYLSLALSTFLLLAYTNCGPNAIFSAPGNSRDEGTNAGSTVGNPKFVFQVAGYARDMTVELCVRDLRFDIEPGPTYNYVPANLRYAWPVTGGPLSLGADLDGSTYTKINFVLADDCGMGAGLRVTNPEGTFSVASGLMTFRGRIDTSGPGGIIEFRLSDLEAGLGGSSSDQELADSLLSHTGTF